MKIANHSKHPRLSFVMYGDYEVRDIGSNLVEIVLDPDVTVQVRAMVAPTVDPMIWIEGLMRENLSPTVQLKPIAIEPGLSELGWPVIFAHYEIHEDGQLVEERAGVFYRIVHNNAEVLVRLRNGVRWQDRAALLKPQLMTAHVHWPYHENDLVYTLLGYEV